MRARMLALSIGIMLAAFLPVPPQPWLRVLLPVLPLVVIPGLFIRVRHPVPAAGLLALCLVCGVLWALARGGLHADRMLPHWMEGEDIWISGQVRGLPREYDRSRQLDFYVTHSCFALLPDDCGSHSEAFHSEAFRAARVQLTVYDPALALLPGQSWQLRVRLSQPRGRVNPGGFDNEAAYLSQGIRARGYVRETAFNRALDTRQRGLHGVRHRLGQALDRLLPDANGSGVVRALITGDRDSINEAQWQLFNGTGTTHLVVISGLHIGFVAGIAFWLGGLLMRSSAALLTHVPAQRPAALFAMAAAAGYAMLAGFSLPTQRALIMVSVFMCAQLLDRRYPASLGIVLALTLILVRDPLSMLSAGFWLSFGAVAALLLVFSGYSRQHSSRQLSGTANRTLAFANRVLQTWIRPQWVVFVALFVPLSAFMHSVPLVAPLTNVIAIPLISVLAVPMALIAVLLLPVSQGLSQILLFAAVRVVDVLQWLLQLILALTQRFAVLEVLTASYAAIVLGVLASVMLLLPSAWPARYLAPVLYLPLLLGAGSAGPPAGHADVWFLDVGQGLAVVVRTRSSVLVYDTGPGANVVGPALFWMGEREVDHLVISHWHSDHSGGLQRLMESHHVHHHLAGSQTSNWPMFVPCERGQSWQRDGVMFDVLHPGSAAQGRAYRRENDQSCVLRVTAGTQRLLLTGDIESAAEQSLLDYPVVSGGNLSLSAELMQVPHHGSATSSSEALLLAVAPQVAVYSAGHRNRFGHPVPEVIARYQARGTAVYGTSTHGALHFRLGAEAFRSQTLQAMGWRRDRPRYWRLP